MSCHDGLMAINLEMPGRVPRTEYSADTHWELVRAVTGMDVGAHSGGPEKDAASRAFRKAWNYDFVWNILIGAGVFGDKCTKMGHAEYAAGGADYDTRIHELYTDPGEAIKFDPFELYGAVDMEKAVRDFNANWRRQKEATPDAVAMTGIYVTCMSGLIDIFGWDMLLTLAGVDPGGMGALTNRYAAWIQQYFDALAKSDAPVVMVHDDIVWTSGAFVHPDWYRAFVFPNYKKFFKPLIESGKKIMYTSDGTYTEFVGDIAGAGAHGFVMEPTTDMAHIAEKYGKTHFFVGNADTRVLLAGTRGEIEAEVRRCMDIGKKHPGFFMAVGNHIPANTPVENALWYNEAYEKLGKR
ncbi:MAG: uroporphyrinogen decarboxylase family protein [Kiritimatiellaeota bacterium]|nr:uroporphyrinogen decarboxylase family protein [Kiritimatiellota bacterium]